LQVAGQKPAADTLNSVTALELLLSAKGTSPLAVAPAEGLSVYVRPPDIGCHESPLRCHSKYMGVPGKAGSLVASIALIFLFIGGVILRPALLQQQSHRYGCQQALASDIQTPSACCQPACGISFAAKLRVCVGCPARRAPCGAGKREEGAVFADAPPTKPGSPWGPLRTSMHVSPAVSECAGLHRGATGPWTGIHGP
jgi:hypothetical protein